jgi:hypothetical protein
MKPHPSEISINARLTGEYARRFDALQKREGLSSSDLLREALRAYHAERLRPRVDAAELLADSGFIGGFDGPRDLSTHYKRYLSDALEQKMPWQVHEHDDDPR